MKKILIYLILPMLLFGADNLVISKRVEAFSNGVDAPRITMNLAILGDKQNFKDKKPVTIVIDDNKSLTFIPQRFDAGKKEGDFSWVGKSEDGRAKAILSVRNGVMVGTLTCSEGTFKIYPENGHYKVIKLDATMAIPFSDDMVLEEEKIIMPSPQSREGNFAQDYGFISYTQPQESSDTVQASQASSTDSVVTLLVYYTQALKDEYGANTEAMIQSNLDLAKDAYINSDTEINLQVAQIKLVPAGSHLSSANSTNLSDLLNKLREDGLVRYERQLYNADAVTVFSKYPGSGGCGLGVTPQSTSSTLVGAYTAVHIKPTPVGGGTYCSDLSFAHELGHNFGCFHDSNHASGTPMYGYAYGYDLVNEFATIMSYDKPEISFFSNPQMTYYNAGTGHTSTIGDSSVADNARVMRNNQYKMADNSEQISEALESSDNDSLNGYAISGRLNNSADRDAYIVLLEGSTILDKSYHGFYMNIYDEDTHRFITSSSSDLTYTFLKGRYRIVVALSDDGSSSYYLGDGTLYTVDITTQYVVQADRKAVNDSTSVNEDNIIYIDVLANDEENASGKAAVKSVTNGSHGLTTITVDGKIKYTPNQNYFGTDSFSYTNTDTYSANVSVTINAVEDDTIAVNDIVSMNEDTQVNINVLMNDIDVDSSILSPVSSVTQGRDGTTSMNNDGGVTYIPKKDYFGTDSFTYRNLDGNSATVYVTVDAVEDKTIAVNDSVTTSKDTVIYFNVLDNDTDVDGTTKASINSIGLASNGLVVKINNVGNLKYTPNKDFIGSDSFTYTNTDGNSALVSITVSDKVVVEHKTIAIDDSAKTLMNQIVYINVLANDTDADGNVKSAVSSVTQGSKGTVIVTYDGRIKYTPNQNYIGQDSFTYKNRDGNSAVVVIEVNSLVKKSSAMPAVINYLLN